MAKNHQQGFGIVEVIMITVTILILCVIAFATWKSVSGGKEKNTQQDASETKPDGSQSTQERSQEVTPEQKAKFEKVRQNIQEAVKKKQIEGQ